MAQILGVILLILWLMGYIQVPGLTLPDSTLFIFNGHAVTLVDVIVLLVFLWLINHLPDAFRTVAILLLLLWLLSIIGIIAVSGLSNILVVGLVIGLIIYLTQGKKR